MANGTLKVSNIQTSSGSGTITIGQSGETITIPSGATVSGAMSSTPAFEAYLSANADISNTTDTKVNCNTEVLDTDSAYDNSSNYRFTVPSGEAGKYYIYGSVTVQTTGGVSTNRFGVGKLYKNGSVYRQQYLSHEDNNGFSTIHNMCAIMDLSVGDYIELYYYGGMSSGVPRVRADDKGTHLGGYKLIGV